MLPVERQALASLRTATTNNGVNISQLLNGLQNRTISIQDFDRDRKNRERVVILGSGWAGYSLSRDLDSQKYQVVVVSPRSYFAFTPLLASCAVGTLEFRTALEPVRSRSRKAEFFQGWAEEVDFQKKTLTIEEAIQDQGLERSDDLSKKDKSDKSRKGRLFELGWDKLVVSVGCYSQTFGTPGVRENAFFLKDVGDARKIRNRLLECFETASFPSTSEQMKKQLLHFAIVGGGPTGIEFSAELNDLIREDLAKLYPDLVQYYKITVYDVADKVLPMFDEKLGQYAMKTLKREGVRVLTSHHVEGLRVGCPKDFERQREVQDTPSCYTLTIKEQGEIGVGMCVWSTGLMMNPFVEKLLQEELRTPTTLKQTEGNVTSGTTWAIESNPKSHAIMTNDRLRMVLKTKGKDTPSRIVLEDVFAIGDCAMMEDTMLPATAQVANQKANWLAKRLNRGDLDHNSFTYKDLGVMAYLGNWNAIMQSNGADISGRAAWVIWRGAYLAKSVSLRNKLLIPTYWFLNWVFGRDISRF